MERKDIEDLMELHRELTEASILEPVPEEVVETVKSMIDTAKSMAEESAEASSANDAEKWAAAAKHLTIAASNIGFPFALFFRANRIAPKTAFAFGPSACDRRSAQRGFPKRITWLLGITRYRYAKGEGP